MTTCMGSGTYETALAQSYAIAGNCSSNSSCTLGGYTALFHPSEPNYIALVGGNNFGITDDGNCCYEIDQPKLIALMLKVRLVLDPVASCPLAKRTTSVS